MVTGKNEEILKKVRELVGNGETVSPSAENAIILMLRNLDESYCYVRATDKFYILISSKGNLYGSDDNVNAGSTFTVNKRPGIFSLFAENKPKEYKEGNQLYEFVRSNFENVVEIIS